MPYNKQTDNFDTYTTKNVPKLKITARGETLETEYFDPISDNVTVNWSQVDIPGRSVPLYVYNKTQGQTFDIKFYLWANYDAENEVVGDAKWLKSLAYPEYKSRLTLPPAIVHIEFENIINFDCVINSVNVTYVDVYNDKTPIKADVTLSISVTSIIPFDYKKIKAGNVPSLLAMKTFRNPPDITVKKYPAPKVDIPNLTDLQKKLKKIKESITNIKSKIDKAVVVIKDIKEKVDDVKRITSALKRFADNPSLRNLTEILGTVGQVVKDSGLSNSYINDIIDEAVAAGESTYQLQQNALQLSTTTSLIAKDITAIKRKIGK